MTPQPFTGPTYWTSPAAGLTALFPFLVPPLYGALAASDFVPREERKLAAAFDDEWRSYAARVRRWI